MIPPITLEIIVVSLGLLSVLWAAFSPPQNHRSIFIFSVFALCLVLGGTFFLAAAPSTPQASTIWSFYVADPAAVAFKRIALIATIVVILLTIDHRPLLERFIPAARPGAGQAELLSLFLMSCAGLMFLASARDLIFAFVSLELVTISLYVLVSYTRRNQIALEAGVKYLILGALSTGFFVYGIAWLVGITGETSLARIAVRLSSLEGSDSSVLFAFLLLFVGLGFKVGSAPFHSWVPDVYQGAPTPITAFLSVGSKSAGVLLMLRILETLMHSTAVQGRILDTLKFAAIATLLAGNLAALSQTNFKRLLAYSSIGHAGYLLMAAASIVSTDSPFAPTGVSIGYYICAYSMMTLLCFIGLNLVEVQSGGSDIADFNGLAKRSKFLAFSLLVASASLAGVPFTAGFYAKFLVFSQSLHAHQYALLACATLSAGAGFYFYFKLIAAMWWNDAVNDEPIRITALTRTVIAILTFGVVFFGVYPKPILRAFSPARPVAAAL